MKTERKKRGFWKRAALIGGGAMLFWALLPLVNGIHGVGVVVPAAVALAALAWGFYRPPLNRKKRKGEKPMTVMIVACLCAVALLGAVFSALMIGSAAKAPVDGATVIVLGSKIYGDRPSRMMRSRLDAAADFLIAHPAANCVVSGGLGEGETYTEAYVMKKYLTEQRGIAAERIACEDKSTNTRENTAFSMEVIREQGWSTDVGIATQVFHQYRAAVNVRTAGATKVGGVACFSPPHLMLNYWVRECAAICRLWLLGY